MSLSEKGTQHSYERHGGGQRLKRKANIEITCIKHFFFLTEKKNAEIHKSNALGYSLKTPTKRSHPIVLIVAVNSTKT